MSIFLQSCLANAKQKFGDEVYEQGLPNVNAVLGINTNNPNPNLTQDEQRMVYDIFRQIQPQHLRSSSPLTERKVQTPPPPPPPLPESSISTTQNAASPSTPARLTPPPPPPLSELTPPPPPPITPEIIQEFSRLPPPPPPPLPPISESSQSAAPAAIAKPPIKNLDPYANWRNTFIKVYGNEVFAAGMRTVVHIYGADANWTPMQQAEAQAQAKSTTKISADEVYFDLVAIFDKAADKMLPSDELGDLEMRKEQTNMPETRKKSWFGEILTNIGLLFQEHHL